MKIEWAPINIPLRRRMQTLAVAIFTAFMLTARVVSCSIMAIILFFGNIYWKMGGLLYIAYIYYDHTFNYSTVSGIGLKFLRNNFMCRLLREYFPIELVKTCDLRPDRNYILCCYPHGIYSVSTITNLAFDIQPWLELFPMIRPKGATINFHIWVPFMREICRFTGGISVDKESLLKHLCLSNDPKDPINRDGFTSNAVAIAIGGAVELARARPREYAICLKTRNGFVKVALQTGCPLVPVFSFGEVDIFNQVDYPPNSLIRKIQKFFQKLTRVPFPILIYGRGFFQYSFGLLPYRKRIVQVVGAPIEVKKSLNPTDEEVNQLHRKFTESLIDLFETHKSKYLENSSDLKLQII